MQDSHLVLHTFSGTRLNRSLAFLLRALNIQFIDNETNISFQLMLKPALLPALFERLFLFAEDVDFHLQTAVADNPLLLDFAK